MYTGAEVNLGSSFDVEVWKKNVESALEDVDYVCFMQIMSFSYYPVHV